jgi:anaerobic glycerol-3-phosphate dehydrogenase
MDAAETRAPIRAIRAREVLHCRLQPTLRATVHTELRPTTGDGTVEFENLRAAGSVLGGYDFAAEKSGSGVSIATGHAAGTAAAEAVR